MEFDVVGDSARTERPAMCVRHGGHWRHKHRKLVGNEYRGTYIRCPRSKFARSATGRPAALLRLAEARAPAGISPMPARRMSSGRARRPRGRCAPRLPLGGVRGSGLARRGVLAAGLPGLAGWLPGVGLDRLLLPGCAAEVGGVQEE